MSALTLRLPDHKHERLKAMASQRGISLAKLLASEGYDPQFGARPLKRLIQRHQRVYATLGAVDYSSARRSGGGAQALVEFDTETRFAVRAQSGTGRVQRGLELLRKAQDTTQRAPE